MKIVLCGMMGCGKTTVAAALAEAMQCNCVDTDALIEEKYGKISNIFAEKGEAYFRGLETECVRGLGNLDCKVVSVGGGLVIKPENVALIREWGKIVYLRAEKETLMGRLEKDTTRPLLQGGELANRLDQLFAVRASVYESVCDFAVSVDKKTPAEIAGEIMEKIDLMGAGI